jgi:uncharacterized protein
VRIAIVGTGIAGSPPPGCSTAARGPRLRARRARRRSHQHRRRARAGPGGAALGIDTGFIVYNEVTYPLLVRLFDELGVATQPSDMSWSLRCEHCDLEYAGNARGVVAQPRNLADPAICGCSPTSCGSTGSAAASSTTPAPPRVPLGRFLDAGGVRPRLPGALPAADGGGHLVVGHRRGRGLPAGHAAALLPQPRAARRDRGHHPWRTVVGGSSSYLPPLTAGFGDRIHRSSPVETVSRDGDGVSLRAGRGLAPLRRRGARGPRRPGPRDARRPLPGGEGAPRGLGVQRQRRLAAHRHRPAALQPARLGLVELPPRRLPGPQPAGEPELPHEPAAGPRRARRVRRDAEPLPTARAPSRAPALHYTHPAYTPESLASQDRLDELNGRNRTFFVGPYQRYGFHEDGVWSAVRAASHLGVRWPV